MTGKERLEPQNTQRNAAEVAEKDQHGPFVGNQSGFL
jgi:hypothetical protein